MRERERTGGGSNEKDSEKVSDAEKLSRQKGARETERRRGKWPSSNGSSRNILRAKLRRRPLARENRCAKIRRRDGSGFCLLPSRRRRRRRRRRHHRHRSSWTPFFRVRSTAGESEASLTAGQEGTIRFPMSLSKRESDRVADAPRPRRWFVGRLGSGSRNYRRR